MTPPHFHLPSLILLLTAALPWGCTSTIPTPDLGERYGRAAMRATPHRNPVIVIPGILGSKLIDPDTDTVVWGAFAGGSASPGTDEGARLIALPMDPGKSLAELTDRVRSDGALDSIRLKIFGLPVEVEAYAAILGTLGVGGYKDSQLGGSGAIDYGDEHYTCFQFDYDWRRDNVENAHRLMEFIAEKRGFVQKHLAEDFGGASKNYDVKFDIVAHSMGGLLTRYMLRYGDADLPDEGEMPAVTWAGAEHVDRVVLIGTPNAGTVNALEQLVNGAKFSPFFAAYSPAILGTMPSLYQLLPRDRHRRVVYKNRPVADDWVMSIAPRDRPEPSLFSARTWSWYGWGMASPDQDRELARLLPGVESPEKRREIAMDHLRRCLARAERFHAALDVPAALPDDLSLTLYAGDGVETRDLAVVNHPGHISRFTNTPGDGVVTRESALMDERMGNASGGGEWSPHLVSPIDWTDVNFLFTDHLGLTSNPVFADNVLYLLLESPNRKDPAAAADVMP